MNAARSSRSFERPAFGGAVLQAGSQLLGPGTYNASNLANDYPNLDLYDPDGVAGADTITISLFVTGTDNAGQTRHFARQVVLQGEEVQVPAEVATVVPPRRRAVGR
jgi:hypothetical protein